MAEVSFVWSGTFLNPIAACEYNLDLTDSVQSDGQKFQYKALPRNLFHS